MAESNNNGRKEFYSLYATNLPVELNENGIKKIFNKFGTVTSILAADDGRFAFISYATYTEAESAIAGLDGMPPLNIRVEFRKKKSQDSSRPPQNIEDPQPSNNIRHIPDYRYNDSVFMRNMGAHPGVPFHVPPPEMSPYYYNYTKGHSLHPGVYDYYDNIDYPETNALWSRGQLMVDAAGRRFVSLGRGYTRYHIQEPYSGMEDHINRVYEQRNPGAYIYGNDELNQEIGKCLACSKNALLYCATCEGCYCSQDCQKADWAKHKNECIMMMAPLMRTAGGPGNDDASYKKMEPSKASGSSIASGASGEDKKVPKTPPRDINESITNEMPSRKSTPNAKQTLNEVIPQKTDQISKPLVLKKDFLDDDKDFGFKKTRDLFLPSDNFIEVQIIVVHNPIVFSVQKTEDDEKLKDLMIKLNSSTDLMRIKDPIIGNVYASQYLEIWHRVIILDKISPYLKLDYIDYGTIEKVLESADICDIGKLANVPRLARTVRLDRKSQEKYNNPKENDTIKVKMIGTDNDGVINVHIFDKKATTSEQQKASTSSSTIQDLLPPNPVQSSQVPINDIQPLLIERSDRSTISPNVKIPIARKLDMDNNVQNIPEQKTKQNVSPVQQREAKSAKQVGVHEKAEATVQNLPSILDILKCGKNEIVTQIIQKIDDYSVTAVLLFSEVNEDYHQLVNPLKDDCNALASKYNNYKPSINEIICVYQSDGFWRRTRVLSTYPVVKVASFDEGLIFDADKLVPIPPHFLQIVSFSVVLSTTNSFPVKPNSTIMIKVFEKQDTPARQESNLILSGEVCGDDNYNGLKVQIKNWNPIALPALLDQPTAKEKALVKIPRPIEIKSGSKVAIQACRSSSILYVRSLENAEIERYSRVIQDTAKASLVSSDLKTTPSAGDLLLAQFIDGNYYRALVIDVENETAANPSPKIKIGYVDFGNTEVLSSLIKLKLLPTELKNEAYCSKKVTLKGIRKDLPPTEKAMAYLGVIANQETPFICTYTDAAIEDGVTLTSLDGKIVNDLINELLTPGWTKENNTNKEEEVEEEYLKLGDMTMLKLGENGQTIQACFLGTILPGFKYVFAPIDRELIMHISVNLPPLMAKYCESTEFYIPRANELCLAKYDDTAEWCRACCIKPSLTPNTAEIYYLDYGSIDKVKYEDIRMMHKDFLKPCAVGAICSVMDLISDNHAVPSPEQLAKLEKLLIINELYFLKILKYKDAEWTVELPDIKRELIKAGF